MPSLQRSSKMEIRAIAAASKAMRARLVRRASALRCDDGGRSGAMSTQDTRGISTLARRRQAPTTLRAQLFGGARTAAAAVASAGLFKFTGVCLDRNVSRHTLSDTPSGYIQDPRAHPRRMVQYDGISRVGVAALEAMEREKELLQREELAYAGYTTLRIQKLKQIVMRISSTTEELRKAADDLQEEAEALAKVVGQEMEKPKSTEQLLLLKWQQRRDRLLSRNGAFQVDPPPAPAYRVVTQADGREVIERPGHETSADRPVSFLDDAYLAQGVELEELPPELLQPEKTVVTIADVNHVRYVLGLAYRRIERCEDAEKVFYSILADDVTNVDAVESLLEMDTGMEGWIPRIRVLLDYLVSEHAKAVADGRLQPPAGASKPHTGLSGASADLRDSGSRGVAPAGTRSAVWRPLRSRTGPAASSSPTFPEPDAGETPELSSSRSAALPPAPITTAAAISSSASVSPYTLVPRVAPVETALSLLSDLIIEAASRKCASEGEGATSKFFIEALGPIVKALDREYASALLVALFRGVDEQHFMIRFDSEDVSPSSRRLALTVVIAFLKALMARRIHELLPQPTHFYFFTLSKLHTALRSDDRLHESYHICELLIQLYREHSSLYRARMRSLSALPLSPLPPAKGSPSSTEDLRLEEGVRCSREDAGEARPDGVMGSRDSPVSEIAGTGDGAVDAADDVHGVSPLSATSSEPPDLLDDQDADYREALFQYVNDRARDSPALGRRLCLEAIREFPSYAAPWETLALLLHKEDPRKNLRDAIIAARHAMDLEPLNLSVIVILANFYKAAHRYELHSRMMDRYRLLSYMLDEGASEADMMGTVAEIASLDQETPEAQDLVAETGRSMREYMERLEQASTYSMPIDKELRPFWDGPIKTIHQQPDGRPPEVEPHDREYDRLLWRLEARKRT